MSRPVDVFDLPAPERCVGCSGEEPRPGDYRPCVSCRERVCDACAVEAYGLRVCEDCGESIQRAHEAHAGSVANQ